MATELTPEQYREKFKKYSVSQLELATSSAKCPPIKKETLTAMIEERRAAKGSKAKSKAIPQKSAKDKPKKGTGRGRSKDPNTDNSKDPWLFEVGAKVKFPQGRNRKDPTIIKGEILGRFESKGVKKYYVLPAGEGAKKTSKRQNVLLKFNK